MTSKHNRLESYHIEEDQRKQSNIMLEFRLDAERNDNQNICMPIVANLSDVITSFWTTGLPLILEMDSFIAETIGCIDGTSSPAICGSSQYYIENFLPHEKTLSVSSSTRLETCLGKNKRNDLLNNKTHKIKLHWRQKQRRIANEKDPAFI